MNQDPIKEVTRREFAALKHISVRTLDGWIESGKIPARRYSPRCIRIPLQAAEEALREFAV